MTTQIGERKKCELGMSNFDHSIDEGLAEYLQAHLDECAHYAGWNFAGYVWQDDGEFVCEVWQYNEPVEVIRCATLEDIMEYVCDTYGSE